MSVAGMTLPSVNDPSDSDSVQVISPKQKHVPTWLDRECKVCDADVNQSCVGIRFGFAHAERLTREQ